MSLPTMPVNMYDQGVSFVLGMQHELRSLPLDSAEGAEGWVKRFCQALVRRIISNY